MTKKELYFEKHRGIRLHFAGTWRQLTFFPGICSYWKKVAVLRLCLLYCTALWKLHSRLQTVDNSMILNVNWHWKTANTVTILYFLSNSMFHLCFDLGNKIQTFQTENYSVRIVILYEFSICWVRASAVGASVYLTRSPSYHYIKNYRFAYQCIKHRVRVGKLSSKMSPEDTPQGRPWKVGFP